eukprot:1321464-Pyramimonas_sp.AAC.1
MEARAGLAHINIDRRLAPEVWPSPLPRRRRRISKENELVLAENLLDRGMGALALAPEVPRD